MPATLSKMILIVSGMCMLFPGKTSGQGFRDRSFNVEAPVSYDYLQDAKLHLWLTYQLGRHMPFAGFSFTVNDDPVANYGFVAGYKFFPNKQSQAFDLYFIYLLQGDSRKLYAASDVNGISLQNQLGYGFNIHLNEKLYLVHYLAAGIENAWFTGYDAFSDLSISAALGFAFRIVKQPRENEK
jgi:hypothetical protein